MSGETSKAVSRYDGPPGNGATLKPSGGWRLQEILEADVQ